MSRQMLFNTCEALALLGCLTVPVAPCFGIAALDYGRAAGEAVMWWTVGIGGAAGVVGLAGQALLAWGARR